MVVSCHTLHGIVLNEDFFKAVDVFSSIVV